MRFRRTLFPLIGFAALTACAKDAEETRTEAVSSGAVAPPVADPAVVRHMIDSSNAVLAAALEKGDAAAHSAFYTDDGIVMLPNMPAWKGREAIRKGGTDLFAAMDVTDARFNTDDVQVSGDMAVETGTYAMTMTPKGGKAMEDKGKYLTVWKRQGDGSWKIVRDISNSDKEMK